MTTPSIQVHMNNPCDEPPIDDPPCSPGSEHAQHNPQLESLRTIPMFHGCTSFEFYDCHFTYSGRDCNRCGAYLIISSHNTACNAELVRKRRCNQHFPRASTTPRDRVAPVAGIQPSLGRCNDSNLHRRPRAPNHGCLLSLIA